MGEQMRLTAERLRQVLHYEPGTGAFTWLISPVGSVAIGSPAGVNNGRGYIRIRIDGGRYMASKLAWLYVTGEWPKYEIDHRDRNRSNNAWSNLRAATRSQNVFASDYSSRSRHALPRGVSRNWGRFSAAVTIDGVRRHLGTFDTAEEAGTVYARAAARAYGEFAQALSGDEQ